MRLNMCIKMMISVTKRRKESMDENKSRQSENICKFDDSQIDDSWVPVPFGRKGQVWEYSIIRSVSSFVRSYEQN